MQARIVAWYDDGLPIATIVQRDKEIELIFRGKQYARSILAFQRRFGRYPNSLKELEEIKPRSIRQLWKEPMCNCDDGWEVIIAGTPEAMPMGSGPLPPGGAMPGTGPISRSRTPGPSPRPDPLAACAPPRQRPASKKRGFASRQDRPTRRTARLRTRARASTDRRRGR